MNEKIILKTFNTDRLLRDLSGIPIGRVSLIGEYKLESKIPIAVMEVFNKNNVRAIGNFYIDGKPYKVQDDINPVRFTNINGKIYVNNFYLVEVEQDEEV